MADSRLLPAGSAGSAEKEKKGYGKADKSISVRELQEDVLEPWFQIRKSRDVWTLIAYIRKQV